MGKFDKLHNWTKGDPLRAEWLRAMVDAIPRIIRGGRDINIRRAGTRVVIENVQRQFAEELIFVKVDTAAATSVLDTNDNPVQWTYEVTEYAKSGAGYGQWSEMEGGFSGNAFNIIEDQNDGTGVQGHGINHDEISAGFNMSPVPVGTILIATVLTNPDDGSECWFSYVNNVDGACA